MRKVPVPFTLLPVSEWNAESYHRVSGPQTSWGERVLARLALSGHEHVLDAGCGSGRLTAALAARLPHGRVVALDQSWNMLQVARTNLRPGFGARVAFVQAALPAIPLHRAVDVVFSTATFHWIRDHDALFAGVYDALVPGGRLHAQCGGGPNLAVAHALAEAVMATPPFAPHFDGWQDAWTFETAEDSAARLHRAGFVDVSATLEPAPTTLAGADDYKAFVTTVIYRPHLVRLPDALHLPFIDAITDRAAQASPPFTLDYWRLNLTARRPE